MAKFRILLIVILLFLCSFLVAGSRGIKITIDVEGEVFFNTYYEDTPCVVRTFESRGKRMQRLLENMEEREVIKKLFPSLFSDVEGIIRDYLILPKDATASISSDGGFLYSKEYAGKKLNADKLYHDLFLALSRNNVFISGELLEIAPNVTKNDLIKNTTFRSSFSTSYETTLGRIKNIKLATKFLNGTVVKPKEVFSFNNVVGERSVERGFSEALVIENGQYVTGIGGGVCQVATTLYNALLLGDIRVQSVMRHSYPPKYVPHSRDAMVSQYSDLKFQNTTNYNIYIFACATDTCVTVKIYGEYSDVDVILLSEDVGVVPREVEYIENKNLKDNTENVLQEGFDGVKSELYVIRYKNGFLVSKDKIREDIYNSQKKVVERNNP